VEVTLEVYPEMIHIFQIFAPVLPEGQRAIERIGAFLKP
jgi:acetyl esterase/lipase